MKKAETIAKILGLMEEKNLSKDWLVTEIKRKKFKINSSLSSNSFEILNKLTVIQVIKFFKIVSTEDPSIKDVKTITKTLHWLFTDMVSSSDPSISVKAQARKIFVLNYCIEHAETFKENDPNSLVILHSGDGMAIGFQDSAEKPINLAIEVHKALKEFNKNRRDRDKIAIRIGIDTGPVYFMEGIRGQKIFWGPGLISAKRIMDLCEPNQILSSERITKDLRNLSVENKTMMNPIGQYKVKHNELIQIYNIYGKNFGSKSISKKDKFTDKADNYTISKSPDFEFKKVEIQLDVKNLKSMMAHHTWIWEIKNISEKPLEKLFYSIGGDVEKSMDDLNLKIRNSKNIQLSVSTIDVNKPHEKQFYVNLTKPLKKNQKQIITLEYDWEEPLRIFEYVFASTCNIFKFTFTLPNGMNIKTRMLEVAKELGIKKRAEPPPKIEYLKNKTRITWENQKNQKINPHDVYEFQW